MIRSLKASGVGALALLAFGAPSASGASPAKVFLRSAGTIVAKGTVTAAAVSISENCFSSAQGRLVSNGKATDKATFQSTLGDACQGTGFAIAGRIKTVTINSSGKEIYKASPDLAVRVPGSCVYEYSSFQGTSTIPGESLIEGDATGKLNKKTSIRTCAKTQTISFVAFTVDQEDESREYETELGF